MTRPSTHENLSAAAPRLRDLAERRLASARVMQDLSTREDALLAAVDAAGRGEIEQDEVEVVLAMHLNAREACLNSMRTCDAEWAAGAAAIDQLQSSDRDAIQRIATELFDILEAIQATDTHFASELALRRRAAGVENPSLLLLGHRDDKRRHRLAVDAIGDLRSGVGCHGLPRSESAASAFAGATGTAGAETDEDAPAFPRPCEFDLILADSAWLVSRSRR